jgi:hypothetical protein
VPFILAHFRLYDAFCAFIDFSLKDESLDDDQLHKAIPSHSILQCKDKAKAISSTVAGLSCSIYPFLVALIFLE